MKKYWTVFSLIFIVASSNQVFSQQIFHKKGIITVTFPRRDEIGDTVSYSRIHISGSISDSGKVWINGEEKSVYPSGAFVSVEPLQPGENLIEIVAANLFQQDTLDIPLYRIPPKPELPQEPTIISGDFILPDQDVEFYQPGTLFLRFRGSPGGQAEARISDLEKHIPMAEIDAMGMQGIYQGAFPIPAVDEIVSKQIEFRLRGKDDDLEKLKTKSKVTVFPMSHFVTTQTIKDQTVIYTRPYGAILFSLPAGIKLNLIAKYGDYFQVAFTDDLSGFVRIIDVDKMPPGTPPVKANIGGIRIWNNSQWIYVDISISDCPPFRIEPSLDPLQLTLTIFNAAQTSEWTNYPFPNETVKLVQWNQLTTQQYQLVIDLQNEYWGYKADYVGNMLRVAIRRPPQLSDENLFKNVVIAIDPGHGGEQLGAIGATGLLEKDVNLTYAGYLNELLNAAGAYSFLTREDDSTVSLQERIERAEEKGAHIFISCHNNSCGAVSNPVRARGTSSYFKYPVGKPLAELILTNVLRLGLVNFGEIQRSYYVTRQTGMIVCLIEGAFISNPEDEMLLMDADFLHQLARQIFNGIQQFLHEKYSERSNWVE